MKKFYQASQKIALAVLMLVLVAGFAPLAVQASQDISVTIDGVQVAFPDQLPVIIDGRTLVPVGGVFGALDFVPTWDGDAQTATLTRSDFTVIITIGSDVFTTNGAEFTLDVPAQIIEGRTMLPLRAVLESIGIPPANIGWNEATRAITVITNGDVSGNDTASTDEETPPATDEIPEEEVPANDGASIASFQQIVDEYAAKLRAATPGLIAEFNSAAADITDLMELAELSTDIISELAEISLAGTMKLAELHVNNNVGTFEDYMSYSAQLTEVYMEEAARITDVYMELAMALLLG